MNSTYGDRDRIERTGTRGGRRSARKCGSPRRAAGALLIPSFAVERTQELVIDIVAPDSGRGSADADLHRLAARHQGDGDLSQHAAEMRHGDELLQALHSPLVKTTESVEESKALARFTGFHIIIAASGMCDAGRIRHHLRNHCSGRRRLSCWSASRRSGSLGRMLQDGAKEVRISGEEVEVRAAIRRFEDYSGHADAPELMAWLEKRLPIRRTVFLTHGEEVPQIALAEQMGGRIVAAEAIVRPRLDEVYDLVSGELLSNETRPRISPEFVARLDWHNDLTRLLLDINDEVKKAADEKARRVIIRRLRRSLEPVLGGASGTEARGVDEG